MDRHPRRRRRIGLAALLAALLAAVVVGAAAFTRAVPSAEPTQTLSGTLSPAAAVQLPWPSRGQAAVTVEGVGTIESSPGARPLPTASMAKVMTALVVLNAKPLAAGQQGPTITVDSAAIQDYDNRLANGESTVPIVEGEQLSEYQALQALLLPSGNNVAALLARWIAGSEPAFVQLMNARARRLGMGQTNFADASGASTQTVSTPADLVRLGTSGMANPVLAGIVAQPQASLPVAGDVNNLDTELGRAGIVGIKTGSLPAPAGSDFLFAGHEPAPWGGSVTVVGVVQGLPSLDAAFAATEALITAAPGAVARRRVATRGQLVGRYRTAWGSSAPIAVARDLVPAAWRDAPFGMRLVARPLHPPVQAGTVVGRLEAIDGPQVSTTPVRLSQTLEGPGFLWRLARKP